MNVTLRRAYPNEGPILSSLCMRSKAHWGYDAAFMDACRPVLMIDPADAVIVALVGSDVAGMAQIALAQDTADLDHLFVDPRFMGHRVGRTLFDWCVSEARASGIARMMIEADPFAEPFYERMGAVKTGEAPSTAIPGRMLPLMEYTIK